MRSVAMSIFLVGCSGMRPTLDHLAARPDVRYLGDGCYLDAKLARIFACSIDVRPAGQVICAQEDPDSGETIATTIAILTRRDEPGMAYAGRDPDDDHVDHFIDELNARRCHRRWDALIEHGALDVVVPPVSITIRDHDAFDSSATVPFAQLGLRVAPQLAVSHESAVALCRGNVDGLSHSMRVCRRGDEIAIPYEVPSNVDLLKPDFERALRDAAVIDREPVEACSDVVVSATDITCTWITTASSRTRARPRRP